MVDREEKVRDRMLSGKFKEMEETRGFKVMDRSLDFLFMAL